MKQFFRQFSAQLILLAIVLLGTIFISMPVYAPTAEISILGATTTDQEQLDNLVSYQLPPQAETGILAASYLIQNLKTNQILAGEQMDTSLPVASLTKLMTIWTALAHSSMDEVVTVPNSDLINVSPSLGLVAGDKVLVKDLIQACLVGSANDSAELLGKYVAEKMDLPFSELMNQQVIELGLSNSRFSNAMGFDSVINYSSARDLSILVQKLNNKGVFANSGRLTQYKFTSESGRSYLVTATNKLISAYPDLSAIKTGYTNLALGSMISVISKGQEDWLLIVIGSPNREADTLELRKLILDR